MTLYFSIFLGIQTNTEEVNKFIVATYLMMTERSLKM